MMTVCTVCLPRTRGFDTKLTKDSRELYKEWEFEFDLWNYKYELIFYLNLNLTFMSKNTAKQLRIVSIENSQKIK